MPRIIVTANAGETPEGAVLLAERVSPSDFESPHFAAALAERLGWAVRDAHEVETGGGGGDAESPRAGGAARRRARMAGREPVPA